MRIVMPQGTSLLHRALGATDHVLSLDWLDPEARRKVRQVGNDRDKRMTGIDLVPTFRDFPVEVGDHGDQQVCGLVPPELLEQLDQRSVKHANRELKNA